MDPTDKYISGFEDRFSRFRKTEPELPDDDAFEVLSRKIQNRVLKPEISALRRMSGWALIPVMGIAILLLVLAPRRQPENPSALIPTADVVQLEDINLNRIDEATLLEAIEESDPGFSGSLQLVIDGDQTADGAMPADLPESLPESESLTYDEILQYLLEQYDQLPTETLH